MKVIERGWAARLVMGWKSLLTRSWLFLIIKCQVIASEAFAILLGLLSKNHWLEIWCHICSSFGFKIINIFTAFNLIQHGFSIVYVCVCASDKILHCIITPDFHNLNCLLVCNKILSLYGFLFCLTKLTSTWWLRGNRKIFSYQS